ncbi:MAG: hypothetical protein D6731_13780, partial [Planctomycetota bacterium]
MGAFKIVLEEVVLGSPDELGNPNAQRVCQELTRLFNLEDGMAQTIVQSMPIIILDGLDARTAGVVRDRLGDLARAGCRFTTTDHPSETIPRVNWPELPAIARVDPEPPAAVPLSAPHGFGCPNCGAALHLVLAPEGSRSAAALPPPPPLPPLK